MIGVRECLIRNIPAIFIVYLVDCDSADVTIDNDEIEDYGWFELNSFESIDWISSAMRELATAALSGVDKEMIDYTEERGQEYFLYL
jgi:NADH pyrophosphatase NudC (nudix superfamily)